MDYFRPLFLYFWLFNIIYLLQFFSNKIPLTKLNRGSLVSEATALPSEAQSLPKIILPNRVNSKQLHQIIFSPKCLRCQFLHCPPLRKQLLIKFYLYQVHQTSDKRIKFIFSCIFPFFWLFLLRNYLAGLSC